MSNSPLVVYTALSPFKSARKHTIDAVIVHCMAGNLSVETCGKVFQKVGRNASSNYGIGSDGRIALYVDEQYRAWCSGGKDKNGNVIRVNGISGADWDHRAISIEVANDGGEPDWHVSDKAMNSLVDLLADICQRNSIKQLIWKADKKLVGKIDQQNMAVHRWFANKSCPGQYLYDKHFWLMEQTNARLGGSQPTPIPTPSGLPYKVKITCDTLNVRKGPGTSYPVATQVHKGEVYTITAEQNGWGKLKSGAGWICLKYTIRIS